jgi:tRNA threonylcarbamoyl adenosine modification protein YeaZ
LHQWRGGETSLESKQAKQERLTASIILSLETATIGGSVFVGRGMLQLASRTGDPLVSHSTSLLRDINDSLEEAGLSLRDVDIFACASGPGSFTGLRIGIATLKALSSTLERPAAGIPTLKAVAHAAGPSKTTVALLPAGRGELFAQMFSVSNDRTVTELDSAAHLSPQRLMNKYETFRELIWAGPGAHQQRDFLAQYATRIGIAFREHTLDIASDPSQTVTNTWRLAARESNLAAHVAALALQLFERGEVQSAQSIQAIYVRPSDAELSQQCR